MEKFDEYLDKARDLAEDAGNLAKEIAGDVMSKAKELTEEGGKVRELTENAKKQTSAFTLGAKEKVQGVMKDVRAGKEIKQGITELEALPEIEGSIIYRMEVETMVNTLNSLLLIISDKRLDDGSVLEEIRQAMEKIQPPADVQEEETEEAEAEKTDEQKAIENAKAIAYKACARALEAFNVTAG